MKVKVLCRNPDDYLRETKRDIYKVPRNFDPDLHAFEGPREYIRALNATKLEKVFAKPFVGNLDAHRDGVACFNKHPLELSLLVSGSYDGEVCFWDLPLQTCTHRFQAHSGFVRGITFTPDGSKVITVGDDRNIKFWDRNISQDAAEGLLDTVISKTTLMGVSHHRSNPVYATCGETCQLWEETRSAPIKTYQWGTDSLTDVSFNPVEADILAACGSDRSIILYDTRKQGAVRKVIMKLRTNKLCWNPMEAFVFVSANEDYNLYAFDMRKLNVPVNVYMDHTSAVTHVDYSPTGKEFVSGSYDRSIRIYETHKSHSRDIYHTKRMQRVTSVLWTLDNKYVLSGSDEMNIRIWKARSAEKLGVLKPRERRALNYGEGLKAKYASHPQIKRIARHRQVPKHIYQARKELRTIKEKECKKEANRRAHSKQGTVPYVPERRKHVVEEKE